VLPVLLPVEPDVPPSAPTVPGVLLEPVLPVVPLLLPLV